MSRRIKVIRQKVINSEYIRVVELDDTDNIKADGSRGGYIYKKLTNSQIVEMEHSFPVRLTLVASGKRDDEPLEDGEVHKVSPKNMRSAEFVGYEYIRGMDRFINDSIRLELKKLEHKKVKPRPYRLNIPKE